MKKERMYGLDILRILSMLGIVGLHILNKGGWGNAADTAAETLTAQILSAVYYCSVDVFAMLTGFLYADRPNIRSSSLYKLLLTVAFYCVAITGIFFAMAPGRFLAAPRTLLRPLIPFLSSTYWYVCCYVFLFLMIPYLNTLIRALPEIRFRRMLLLLFLLMSVVTTFSTRDLYRLGGGYSPFWLIFCYLTGAYIKLYPPRLKARTALLLLALDVLLIVCGCRLLGDELLWSDFPILCYTSPFIYAEAAIGLSLFSRVTVHAPLPRKILRSFSDAAFGVYLIHAHYLVFYYPLKDSFLWAKGHPYPVYLAAMLGGLVGIYLICWVIEQLRGLLFRWLRVDRLADWLGKKTDTFLHWDRS